MNNYLKQRGISASDFAQEIGCAPATVYRVIKSEPVTPQIFAKIKKATGDLVSPWIAKRGRGKGAMTKWAQTRLDHGKILEYRIWFRMMEKCYNQNFCEYRSYGEKGITVCIRWHDFKLFMEDMGKIPTEMKSLILDPLKLEFNKKNCSWAIDARRLRGKRMGPLAYKSIKRPKKKKKPAQIEFDETGTLI